MENKYYTPEIEEFHVGFECEFKNSMQSNTWEKETCDTDTVNIAYSCIEHEDIDDKFEDAFRVKYLDKEDIESLGFKHYKLSTFNNNKYTLERIGVDNKIIIHYMVQTIFIGKIKNKSELKKLLKQLGI